LLLAQLLRNDAPATREFFGTDAAELKAHVLRNNERSLFMRVLVGVLAFSFGVAVSTLVPERGIAQTSTRASIAGVWQGIATVNGDVQVPISIYFAGDGNGLTASFLNGSVEHPDTVTSSSASFDGTHLTATFDYFARTLEATLANGVLNGTYGAAHPGQRSSQRISFQAKLVSKPQDPEAAANAPDISGSWEIATKSSKGEGAWELVVDRPESKSQVIKTAIQRIDGDTGGLWGVWNGTSYTVTHFTAAGPAAYSITPQPDGTLLLKNLASAPTHGASAELVAKRSVVARKENLPAPTDPTQQTNVKDPKDPFAFSFPDLSGKTVSNIDPQFQGKVLIVAIGGSWCPNCHDEAPFLVSLYKKFHSHGLEIVNVDFEQGDPDTDLPRLRAFIAHYGIDYPVLLGGTTDQLQEKFPQATNLNCWPTSFFIGRDALVRQTHAGFAGPGNTAGHEELEKEVTTLIEKLLAETAPTRHAEKTVTPSGMGK
jgi:thiol-disulfide isomerase/thioredoxin